MTNGNEDCDDGILGSLDCNPNCTPSQCGDQVVNSAAGETCDNGLNNTVAPGGACRPVTCELGGCGDGIIDPGEECDQAALGNTLCGALIVGSIGAPACAEDCTYDLGSCPGCDNGSCEATETATSCRQDCGALDVSGQCAVLRDGTVKCWGANGLGQLGDGTFKNRFTPGTVAGLDDAVQVSDAGFNRVCARRATGSVMCWGTDLVGLGDAAGTTESNVPVAVAGITNALKISAGDTHACAIVGASENATLSDGGRVVCWGANGFGELGNGGTTDQPTPVDVNSIVGDAIDISAGFHHTCAVLKGGTVACWGRETELGAGGTSEAGITLPRPVTGLVDVASIGPSGGTCVVTTTGGFRRLKCWSAGTAPVITTTATSVKSVTRSGCLVSQEGNVSCFGVDSFGSNGGSTATTNVATLGSVRSATSGASTTCVVLNDDTVRCWGSDRLGALGIDSKDAPTGIITAFGITNASMVSKGQKYTVVARTSGQSSYWGHGGGIGFIFGFVAAFVDAGLDETFCALNSAGSGNCNAGIFQVNSLSGLSQFDHGNTFLCAVGTASTKRVTCWGSGALGQLGSSGVGSSAGIDAGVGNISDLAVGANHSCAVAGSGEVFCWGDNTSGQLGSGAVGFSSIPTQVLGMTTDFILATKVAASNATTCVLLSTTAVMCFGDNTFGVLGQGTEGGTSAIPTIVPGLSNVTAIQAASRGEGMCALLGDKTVKCWGQNDYGDVGNGDNHLQTSPIQVVEAPVEGVSAPLANVATLGGSCVTTTAGEVKCWGSNIFGEAGNGNIPNQTHAALVQPATL